MKDSREQWLGNAAGKLAPLLKDAGHPMPANVRYTCGFPSRSALARKKRRIGECWDTSCSADQTFEILISPTIAQPADVLAILIHEMIHAAVGLACGHKGAFKKCAKAVGLEGPMTATHAGPDLLARLNSIAAELGEYPHAKLEGRQNSGAPKQSTRLLKIECPDCGWTARATAKWIETGLPTCQCGGQFTTEENDTDDED